MNKLSIKWLLLVMVFALAINVKAQHKTYLSGEDAATAVDWQFKVSEGRNSGFWTTIPVPSNWETEGFGYYLYGMDKMEGEKPCVGFYKHSFEFLKNNNKRYFIVFQDSRII